jgi:hypothetical protein
MHPICTKIDKNILIKNSEKMVTHPRQRLWPGFKAHGHRMCFFYSFRIYKSILFNKRGTLQFFNGLEGYYFN